MPTTPSFYSAYERPTGTAITFNKKDGKTLQSFKDECNINTIVNSYMKTGMWGNSLRGATSKPMFGDFTSVPDFVESQNIIAKANEMFDAMPLNIRKRFNYNPEELLAFVNDENNKEEAIKLGIATEKPKPEPEPTPVTPQTPPNSPS